MAIDATGARAGALPHTMQCVVVDYAEARTSCQLLLASDERSPAGCSWQTQVDAMAVLFKHGADLNAVTDKLTTPLLLAVRLGNVEAVRCLLEEKADPMLQTRDKYALRYSPSALALVLALTQPNNVVLSEAQSCSEYSLTRYRTASARNCFVLS